MEINITKADFSCWGNGDKYDDELFIRHNPKITAVELADKILKNQEKAENYDGQALMLKRCQELGLEAEKIVERLRKQIADFNDQPEENSTNMKWMEYEVAELLEEILGEKK